MLGIELNVSYPSNAESGVETTDFLSSLEFQQKVTTGVNIFWVKIAKL
jgi:hypothetical protein